MINACHSKDLPPFPSISLSSCANTTESFFSMLLMAEFSFITNKVKFICELASSPSNCWLIAIQFICSIFVTFGFCIPPNLSLTKGYKHSLGSFNSTKESTPAVWRVKELVFDKNAEGSVCIWPPGPALPDARLNTE